MDKGNHASFKENKENKDTHNEQEEAEIALEEEVDNENKNPPIDSPTSEIPGSEPDAGRVEGDVLQEAPSDEGADLTIRQVIKSESSLLIQNFTQLLESHIDKILNVFEQKLAYDATKQQQIDRLHAEVQQYRTDLIAKTNRPLVNGIIQLHGDIGKLAENLKTKTAEELKPERVVRAFAELQSDIEILLDQNGIVAFTEPSDNFEPKRQRAVRNVKTPEAHRTGTIAERLRPGFEQGADLIQKERVSVYVFDEEAVLPSAASQSKEEEHVNRVENAAPSNLPLESNAETPNDVEKNT